jgi:hypothetical protein
MTTCHSKPSVDSALARVARAGEHIARIEDEVAALAKNVAFSGRFGVEAGVTGLLTDEEFGLPLIIAILIGETIYNLHAALDYLVYELAILDSGNVQQGTYFPIESSPDGWDKHVVRGNFLSGVSDVHKAQIHALQPFNGVEWTARIRDISNPDKHRQLTVGWHGPGVRIEANWSTRSQTIGQTIDQSMDIQGSFTYVIHFDDRSTVIETLKLLQQQVSDVINAFKHEFK